METNVNLDIWLVAWIVIVLIIFFRSTKKNIASVGLTITFAFMLTKQYWFGAFIYSLPWYEGGNKYHTALGFVKASQALLAFAAGSIIFAPFLIRIFRFSWLKSKKYRPNLKLPIIYIAMGYIFYFLLRPILVGKPSIRTFIYSGWNLMLAGLCLIIWKNWCIKNQKMIIFWLLFAGLAPLFTTIGLGFLGVGVMALMVVVIFTSRFYRPRWKIILGVIIIGHLGFSFYVNYMQARGEIREKISQGKPVSDRTGVVLKMFNNFEFFNLTNQKHLELIEVRLNQSALVGAAVDYMQLGNQEFAKGETIKNSLLAIIPRMFWPDKPIRLGGAGMATKYTGITFQGASVGMGLVMEFFINFGTICVVVGFLILGVIITLVDQAAALRLEAGDWKGFIFWFVPGITLMGGESLTQITMSASAAVVFAIFINKYILPIFSRQKRDKI